MTVKITPITDAELLSAVKNSLNISGEHFDSTLSLVIDEVKGYLMSAGVPDAVLGSTLAVGCIARGVSDLWNYGNGDTKLSEYFYQRAAQLRCIEVGYSSAVSVALSGTVIKNQFVVSAETDILKIGISGFDLKTDELQLFVNGLKFDSTRYTILDNETIRLAYPIIPGTAIEIVTTRLVSKDE